MRLYSETVIRNEALEAAAKVADAERKQLQDASFDLLKNGRGTPGLTAGAIAARRIAEGIRALMNQEEEG
jgi:hypothetical protein